MKTSTTLNPDLAAMVNREFGSMSVTDQLNREIYRLREENERFKVMYKGFEIQALTIMRYRTALERIANWDKLPEDPCWDQIAREALEEI